MSEFTIPEGQIRDLSGDWHLPEGLFSDSDIRRGREAGAIVIEPFDAKQIGTNSYDVRLGEWFYREQHPVSGIPVYNPYSSSSVARVWGHVDRAVSYKKLVEGMWLPPGLDEFKDDDLVIMLAPGETILCHTIEFIGGRKVGDHGVVPCMHARSSIGRSLMCVCKAAGYGDVGFFNRWTMELTSFSQWHWIPLKVGTRIAQIDFQTVHNVEKSYDQIGAYQGSDDIRGIVESWRPDMMIPKLRP